MLELSHVKNGILVEMIGNLNLHSYQKYLVFGKKL